jgi:hypothetical protein
LGPHAAGEATSLTCTTLRFVRRMLQNERGQLWLRQLSCAIWESRANCTVHVSNYITMWTWCTWPIFITYPCLIYSSPTVECQGKTNTKIGTPEYIDISTITWPRGPTWPLARVEQRWFLQHSR